MTSAIASQTRHTGTERIRELRVVAGREIYFDTDGFFWDADDWTAEIAEALARESGIDVLDDVQWRVIRFLREYYLDQGRAPTNRELRAGVGLSLVELERAFPAGIKLGAKRLAGIPIPQGCID